MSSVNLLVVFALVLVHPALSAEWDYDDPDTEWTGTCKTGTSQSPIDIKIADATTEITDTIDTSKWGALTGATAINNGHTIQVNAPDTSKYITGVPGSATKKFHLAQFHFHWGADSTKGSEHVMDGKSSPAEVHFVHFNEDFFNLSYAADKANGLAVIGVLIEEGDANAELKKVFDLGGTSLMNGSGSPTATVTIDPTVLLPANFGTNFYSYSGSLTTPGCYESVNWIVSSQKITASAAELAELRKATKSDGTTVIGKNYRPPQALGSRTVSKHITAESDDDDAGDNDGSSASSVLPQIWTIAIGVLSMFFVLPAVVRAAF